MSKAAKQSIFILIFLLIASLGFAGYTVFQKQRLETLKKGIEADLEDAEIRIRKYAVEIKTLKDKVKRLDDQALKLSADKTRLSNEVARLKSEARDRQKQLSDLSEKLAAVQGERDRWKQEIGTLRREKESLSARVDRVMTQKKDLEETLAEMRGRMDQRLTEVKTNTGSVSVMNNSPSDQAVINKEASSTGGASASDELYWAGVLKEKASLEIKLKEFEKRLEDKAVEIVGLKQTNESLMEELDSIRYEKAELQREAAHKDQVINTLSLELARAKNDKKFMAQRVAELNQENDSLRKRVKRMIGTKGALEKAIVRLSRDKKAMEEELGRTEAVIQSKINEIWDIKDSLDQTVQAAGKAISVKREVELPPIVVNRDSFSGADQSRKPLNGRIVSINKENNFVVLDIGANAGLRLGDRLGVYRKGEKIARLEVIQVRKDIAAADLKDQWDPVRVGDIVR